MGIQGLLPLLKSIHKPTHLRDFAGQTLGVDAYGWLHRGTVSCAIELAQQKPTRKHIDFALNRVRMLLHFGVKPFLVFDGDYLPSKAHTETQRAARRNESRRLGLELIRMGRLSQAHLELQKAVDVTPRMARELIEELKRLDVPYVVAPYEADSQLAYLEKQGVISGILSEDSDLLVFGTKCLLTKLDQHGECVMINRADFTACREISLVGWTDKEFRMMAMLSGCDYLPGIDKIGLKTSYRLVRKHKVIDRIIRTVQFDGKTKVPAGYLDSFARAEHTFLYQWVFCPETQSLENLNKIPVDLNVAEMPYIGKFVEPEIAVAVAAGDLDPNSKEKIIVQSRQHHPAQRTNTMQTPNEKQGVPISEFFKPRRTPLAELDPNCFTPSPSQQRLLETQQTASWSASEVREARRPALRSAGPGGTPSTAPQIGRRTVSSPWPTVRRLSPKRQRLCSENLLAATVEGSGGSKASTSRFFSKPTAQTGPSLRKTSEQKNHDEVQIWSDDSTAEAIAAMDSAQEAAVAEHTPSPKKRKKLGVYADPPNDLSRDVSQSAVVSQESTQTVDTAVSSAAQDTETPATSFGEEPAESSLFSRVHADFTALKNWAFVPSTSRQGVVHANSPPSPVSAEDGIGRDETSREEPQTKLSGPLHLPPSPINRAQTPEQTEILVTTSSPVERDCTSLEDGNEGGDLLGVGERRIRPERLGAMQGSEDLLVPNSPGSGCDDEIPRPKIDFGRFAFAG